VRLRPGLGGKAFCSVTSLHQQQVVFSRPSGPAEVDVKSDLVGLDPLELLAQHVLVGTGCLWGATIEVLAPVPAVRWSPDPGRLELAPSKAQ